MLCSGAKGTMTHNTMTHNNRLQRSVPWSGVRKKGCLLDLTPDFGALDFRVLR